MISFPYLKVDS